MFCTSRSLSNVAREFATRHVAFSRHVKKTHFSSQPIIELREYELKPEFAGLYMQATADAAELRKSYVPLRFFSLPETGGQLMVATHAYYYAGGHSERDAKRAALGADDRWKEYITKCRPYVGIQHSTIWTEAPFVQEIMQESNLVHGLASVPDSKLLQGENSILELRRYKLKLGYDTVPTFMELYKNGLPSKLNAPGSDPSTSLVTVVYTEVGRLNEVIEIWRHGNGTVAMEVSRQAARHAPEWRTAIANIANDVALEFTSVIHKPTSFSPIQ
jgi:NIPSNAP